MSKKRKSLRAPFLITVAGATALLFTPACGSDVSNNPPFPDPKCPETLPAQGDVCEQEGDFCGYQDSCERSATASCTSFEGAKFWNVQGFSGPCANGCPDEPPAHGTVCAAEGVSCSYTVDEGCGPEPLTAECTAHVWDVEFFGSSCNPPFPLECPDFLDEASCGSSSMCRWLEPGCGENPVPQALCRSAQACTGDLDCAFGTCKTVSVIPECAQQGLCDSCGEELATCVPD